MRKTVISFALCAMLFALGSPAEAQQAKKVPRIGYLTGASLSSQSANTQAFQQGLRELGYVEGKTLSLSGGARTEIAITSVP